MSKRGLSLVELLTVMLTVGLVFTLLTPVVQGGAGMAQVFAAQSFEQVAKQMYMYEGEGEGAIEGEGEGAVEGEGEGEGEDDTDVQDLIDDLEDPDDTLVIDDTDLEEGEFDDLDVNDDDELDLRELINGSTGAVHSADFDPAGGDGVISLSPELTRIIQFFNLRGYRCPTGPTEDGFEPLEAGVNDGNTNCIRHSADYDPFDFDIDLSELLRIIQFFNSGGVARAGAGVLTEDGFVAGTM